MVNGPKFLLLPDTIVYYIGLAKGSRKEICWIIENNGNWIGTVSIDNVFIAALGPSSSCKVGQAIYLYFLVTINGSEQQ